MPGGVIGLEEACLRSEISNEEFAAWERALDRHGREGLRAQRRRTVQEFGAGSARHADWS